MAEGSGLADLAKRENSVIAFVNSMGDAWREADASAYRVYELGRPQLGHAGKREATLVLRHHPVVPLLPNTVLR